MLRLAASRPTASFDAAYQRHLEMALESFRRPRAPVARALIDRRSAHVARCAPGGACRQACGSMPRCRAAPDASPPPPTRDPLRGLGGRRHLSAHRRRHRVRPDLHQGRHPLAAPQGQAGEGRDARGDGRPRGRRGDRPLRHRPGTARQHRHLVQRERRRPRRPPPQGRALLPAGVPRTAAPSDHDDEVDDAAGSPPTRR